MMNFLSRFHHSLSSLPHVISLIDVVRAIEIPFFLCHYNTNFPNKVDRLMSNERFHEIVKEKIEIHDRKNRDYVGGEYLSNFMMCEKHMGFPAWKGGYLLAEKIDCFGESSSFP